MTTTTTTTEDNVDDTTTCNTVKRCFINLSNVSKYLYCVICREIFNDPHRLQCGHTFCKECIVKWAKMKSGCPICRSYFNVHDIQRDLVGYNMVNELEVYCNNRGCPWKSSLQNLNEHLKQCYFDPKKIPECIRSIIHNDERNKIKNKTTTTATTVINSATTTNTNTTTTNEQQHSTNVNVVDDEEENISSNSINFNTNVSLKARLYYKNRTLMEKVLSKKKELPSSSLSLTSTQSIFDFLNL